MSRYYPSALSVEDHVALVKGEQNHNCKSWTQKDRIAFEQSRRELLPPGTYLGPCQQVCPVPKIILTEGQDQWTHALQLHSQLRSQLVSKRSNIEPFVKSEQLVFNIQARARASHRVTSRGDYFAGSYYAFSQYRLEQPIMARPSDKRLLKDGITDRQSDEPYTNMFLSPHRFYEDGEHQGWHDKKQKKTRKRK